jgi:hypothetical protein
VRLDHNLLSLLRETKCTHSAVCAPWNEETTVCRILSCRRQAPVRLPARRSLQIVWDDPPPPLRGYGATGPPTPPRWSRQTTAGARGLAAPKRSKIAKAGPQAEHDYASSRGAVRGAFPGGHRRGVTPVPIPNTEVKPSTADGTARVTAWESRSLPGVFFATAAVHPHRGRFHVPRASSARDRSVHVEDMLARELFGLPRVTRLAGMVYRPGGPTPPDGRSPNARNGYRAHRSYPHRLLAAVRGPRSARCLSG